MTLLAWAVITLLILVNALYVAAEFGAVSVRHSRIQQRAEEGDWLARQLLPVLQDPQRLDRYIAASQIGITISSLVLGAFGQARLAPALMPVFQNLGGMQAVAAQSASTAVVLIGLTGLQMILGELIPKSLALQYPTRTALYTAVPMRWSLRLLSWFIAVLNGSGILVLRLFGVREAGHRHIHSPDEIEYLIAESREGGLLEAEEHERLRKALRLGVLGAADIMVPRIRIEGLEIGTPFDEVVRAAARSTFTRLPVYEGSLDRIIGIVHVRDLAHRSLAGEPAGLRELLRPIIAVPDTLTLERVLSRLRDERQHMALVVDEFGGTAGLVTVGDVLDEIFGGVADEFGRDEARPERLPDGRVRLWGAMPVADVAGWIGTTWEGDAHTVGGLITERLEHFPRAGESLEIDGARVEVERVSGRVVRSVLVAPAQEGEDDLE